MKWGVLRVSFRRCEALRGCILRRWCLALEYLVAHFAESHNNHDRLSKLTLNSRIGSKELYIHLYQFLRVFRVVNVIMRTCVGGTDPHEINSKSMSQFTYNISLSPQSHAQQCHLFSRRRGQNGGRHGWLVLELTLRNYRRRSCRLKPIPSISRLKIRGLYTAMNKPFLDCSEFPTDHLRLRNSGLNIIKKTLTSRNCLER